MRCEWGRGGEGKGSVGGGVRRGPCGPQLAFCYCCVVVVVSSFLVLGYEVPRGGEVFIVKLASTNHHAQAPKNGWNRIDIYIIARSQTPGPQ